ARRSAKIVPVGKSRLEPGRRAIANNKNPRASAERWRSPARAARTSVIRRNVAARPTAESEGTGRIDQADSSPDKWRGKTQRPRYRKTLTQALTVRGTARRCASAFSTSKTPVPGARNGAPSTHARSQNVAARIADERSQSGQPLRNAPARRRRRDPSSRKRKRRNARPGAAAALSFVRRAAA